MILYNAEEVAEFIAASGPLDDCDEGELVHEITQHRDHMIAGGHEFGRDLIVYAGDRPGGVATMSMHVDDVRYEVVVSKDADGYDVVRFITDPAPRNLDRVRYEWTGDLEKSMREARDHA